MYILCIHLSTVLFSLELKHRSLVHIHSLPFKSLLYFCNMATYLISRLLFLYPLEIQEKTTSNLWLIMEKYKEAHSDIVLSLHSQCLSILMTRFCIIMPLQTIPLLGQHKTWTQWQQKYATVENATVENVKS